MEGGLGFKELEMLNLDLLEKQYWRKGLRECGLKVAWLKIMSQLKMRVSALLNGLPLKFDHVVSIITTSRVPFDLQGIVTSLLDAEVRQHTHLSQAPPFFFFALACGFYKEYSFDEEKLVVVPGCKGSKAEAMEFVMVEMFKEKTRLVGGMSNDHSKLDTDMKSNFILPMTKASSRIPILVLIAHIRSESDYIIFYQKAWLAKQKALEKMHSRWEQSYNELGNGVRYWSRLSSLLDPTVELSVERTVQTSYKWHATVGDFKHFVIHAHMQLLHVPQNV
ncbi:hypothetical protein PVK06_029991 [Gossypium arboreum]|uniref:Uncharacterized protein n=1 Tax=Gossypium arboreum TaxID=29729 RepID=A0ABR0NM38_GOSAR|nr:hypothetical protein PVK06_029991 [Gossypium arboreum]